MPAAQAGILRQSLRRALRPGARPNEPSSETGQDQGGLWDRWPVAVAIIATSAALAFLPTTYAVAVVLAAAALVAGLYDPVWPLALVALAVPFGSSVPLDFGGLGSATDLVIAGALAAWASRLFSQSEVRLNFPAAWLPVPLFVGVLAFSATLAPSATLGAKETLKWLQFALIALAAAHALTTTRQRMVVMGAVLVAASLQGAIGWYQFVTGAGPEAFFLGGLLRAFGTFGQPNPFAGYLALVLPLVVSLALGQPGPWRPLTLTPAVGLTVAAVLIGGGVVLSLSRGGWLAAAAGVGAVLFPHSHRLRIGLLVAMPMLTGLLLTGALDVLPEQIVSRFEIVSRYLSLFDARLVAPTSENYSIVERMAVWQAAAAMWADHPLLGVGAGNFDVAYIDYGLRGWPTPPGHAHNIYLTLLAEAGIIGASVHAIMLAGLFGMVARGLRRFRQEGAPADGYPLALGALGMLVALCVHNLLDNLYVHYIPAHLGLMLGTAAAPLRVVVISLQVSGATIAPSAEQSHPVPLTAES